MSARPILPIFFVLRLSLPVPVMSVRRSGGRALRCLVAGWAMFLALVLVPSPTLLHADVKTGFGDKGDKPSKKDKKDKKPVEFAPEASDITAKFVVGKSVDIELKASVASVKQVEFIIRQQPINGTLSAVRPHPRELNKGIVTYTHNGVDATLSDRFTFACRLSDGPISAPATVTLLGQRFEPILSVLNVTAVNKVFLGGESSLRFTLRNIGPAAYASDMTWESPWRGPPHLELKSGETQELSVIFQPTTAGVFRLDRLLQPGQNTSRLLLYGECVRPLTVSPSRLKLTVNPKTGAREGILILANGFTGPQKADCKLPPRLSGVTTLEVPGSGQTKLLVSLPVQDVAEFKGEVAISTPDCKETVLVEAEAKAALLQLTKPTDGVLDLGSVVQGKDISAAVILKNNGGMPAVVQALPGAAVKVTPAGEAIRIEPGAEGTFLVSLHADQVGELQTEANIQGAGLVLRVPVKVNVLPAPRNKTSGRDSSGISGSGTVASVEGAMPNARTEEEEAAEMKKSVLYRPMLAYLAATGMPISKDNINPYLERVNQIEVRNRSTNSITIAWKKPEMMPAGWSIETASWARVPTGELIKAWVPMKNWEPVNAGDKFVGARLKSLSPESHIEIRLMGVDRDGKVSEPSMFAMETMAAHRWPSWIWEAASVTVLLLLFGALYCIREGYWEPQWEPLRNLLRL